MVAWLVGSVAVTALWAFSEWDANGAFRHFGNQGNQGDWNPTLPALAIGGWGLFVGIKASRMYLERPVSHIAAWALGMVVLTPLWALIEWQDNGSFARWSDNGHRGDWEPWILYVAGIWALVVVALALHTHLDRRAKRDITTDDEARDARIERSRRLSAPRR